MKNIAIIGAGLSGLAAALKISCSKENKVTVFEKNSFCGGKIFSFQKNGYTINNSPHLILSGNKNIFNFLKNTYSLKNIRVQKNFSLQFFSEEKNKFWLCKTNSLLPDYLNLLPSFLRYPHKKISDIFKLGILFKDTYLYKNRNETVYEYCTRIGFSEAFINTYIKNLVESTLNTPITEATVKTYLNVLKKTFFAGSKNSLLAFFKKDLYESIISNAEKILKFRNCKILYNQAVSKINFESGSVKSIIVNNEEKFFDEYIICLQPYQLKKLKDKFNFLDKFNYSPIVAYHFIYDGQLFKEDLIGFFNTHIDWIFKHYECNDGFYYSGVKSCAEKTAELKTDELKYIFIETLNRAGYNIDTTKIRLFTTVKDMKATIKNDYSKQKVLSQLKKVSLNNCRIYGTWTDINLPSTLETAVSID